MLRFDNELVEQVCQSLLTEDQSRNKSVDGFIIPCRNTELFYLEKLLFEYEEKIVLIKKAILIGRLDLEMKADLVEVDEDVYLSGIEHSEF
jgi:hypothetical protein